MTTVTPRTVPAPAVADVDVRPLRAAGLAPLLAALFMAVMDLSSTNVALPAIGADLHASAATLELVVAGYGVPYALVLVIGGRLGDAFGRRRLLVIGVLAFVATSVMCAVAPTGATLVGARMAQGVAAALMVPQLLATVQATTSGAHRMRAIGLYGAAAGFAIVAGQILGGVFVATDAFGIGWRALFAVNVPIGVAVAALAPRLVPETRGRRAGVDVAGTALFALPVTALLVPLTLGHAQRWPAWSIVALLLVVPLLGALVAVERRVERAGGEPLMPTALLRVPVARAGLAITALFFLCFSGFLFSYAMATQRDLHQSAATAGLGLLPFGVAFLVTSVAIGRSSMTGQAAVRRGAALQALGVGASAVVVAATWPHLHVWELAPSLVVTGVAQGMIVPSLFRTILAGVPSHVAGASSGLLNTTQQLAIGLGAAVFGVVGETFAGHAAAGAGFVTVLVVQAVSALLIVWAARRLRV
jgi:MFS family permease